MNYLALLYLKRRATEGYTILELVVCIAIMAALSIVAFIALDGAIESYSLNSAAIKVVSDIRYAKHLARTRNGWHGINFSVSPTNQYTVYSTDGSTDTAVTDPVNPAQNFIFNIGTEFDGVTISAASLGGGSKVEFDPVGMPYDDYGGTAFVANGTITLSSGTSNKIVTVVKNTGKVSVQ